MSQQGVNKLIVLGHVGNDADLKFTSGGKPVANFSVAANESFKNSNGDSVDRVEWFRCVAWNGLAELCGQYLTHSDDIKLSFAGFGTHRGRGTKQSQTQTNQNSGICAH